MTFWRRSLDGNVRGEGVIGDMTYPADNVKGVFKADGELVLGSESILDIDNNDA